MNENISDELDFRFELTENTDRLKYDFNSDHYAQDIYTSSLYRQGSSYDFIFTDRGVYRPWETLNFVGISRDLTAGEYTLNTSKKYIDVVGWNDEPLITRELESNNGLFTCAFQIPNETKPGWYNITTNNGSVAFHVANFRRVSFSVSIQSAEKLPLIVGQSIIASAQAKYLAGNDLSRAEYQLSWKLKPTYFSPGKGNYHGYKFGPDTDANSQYLGSESGQLEGNLHITKETTDSNGSIGMPYELPHN